MNELSESLALMSDPEPDDDPPAVVPRGLLRSLWAHPSDGPERLMLAAVTRLGEPS